MIECTYYYPMKHKDGVDQWIVGHAGFRFTNWKFLVSDCCFVRGKAGKPSFISPPQKKYKNKDGKMVYVWFWCLEDEDMAAEFQIQAKAAIAKFCKEKGMEIPPECESS